MADSTVRVVADDREEGSGVIEALAATDGVAVAVDRLSLGDYFVDDGLRVERKTLPDLAVSIADGRLFRQASRLVTESTRAVVILEGTARDLANSDMRREALQGALITLTLRLDLPLLRAKGPSETARLLCYAARQRRRTQTGAVPRASDGSRPSGKRKTQLYVLQGLPGVGPTRAQRLLEHFGSVEAVMTASVKTLTEVEGIGPKTAQSVRWAVEEASVRYVPSLARDPD
ncbi:MAG: ERCC4 domain-containing protein [Salinivenus sp.]